MTNERLTKIKLKFQHITLKADDIRELIQSAERGLEFERAAGALYEEAMNAYCASSGSKPLLLRALEKFKTNKPL